MFGLQDGKPGGVGVLEILGGWVPPPPPPVGVDVCWRLGADGFTASQFVVKQVLSGGWLPGQAGFTSTRKRGGRTHRHPRGPREQGRVYK